MTDGQRDTAEHQSVEPRPSMTREHHEIKGPLIEVLENFLTWQADTYRRVHLGSETFLGQLDLTLELLGGKTIHLLFGEMKRIPVERIEDEERLDVDSLPTRPRVELGQTLAQYRHTVFRQVHRRQHAFWRHGEVIADDEHWTRSFAKHTIRRRTDHRRPGAPGLAITDHQQIERAVLDRSEQQSMGCPHLDQNLGIRRPTAKS